MATTTLEPVVQSAPVTTTVTTAGTSTSSQSTGAPVLAIPSFNQQLVKQYGIAILSAAIAVFAFIMYRRGSWSRPLLSGMVIGAALLGTIQSVWNIVDITKEKNNTNA